MYVRAMRAAWSVPCRCRSGTMSACFVCGCSPRLAGGARSGAQRPLVARCTRCTQSIVTGGNCVWRMVLRSFVARSVPHTYSWVAPGVAASWRHPKPNKCVWAPRRELQCGPSFGNFPLRPPGTSSGGNFIARCANGCHPEPWDVPALGEGVASPQPDARQNRVRLPRLDPGGFPRPFHDTGVYSPP